MVIHRWYPQVFGGIHLLPFIFTFNPRYLKDEVDNVVPVLDADDEIGDIVPFLQGVGEIGNGETQVMIFDIGMHFIHLL